jgi:1,2-diacylglycerol 3-beta-galactosyltransferase
MTHLLKKQRRILFLFSDTGGGHRSATEAIIAALKSESGDHHNLEMVDILKDYAPRPFNRLPDLYPYLVRAPQAWGAGYRLLNGRRRARFVSASFWPYVRGAARTLVARHPSDLIVATHPIANWPILSALGKNRPPFITIVTDLVSIHALWYNPRADLCIVPTKPARQIALKNGFPPERVLEIGLPVADRFSTSIAECEALRARLGWPKRQPVILLVGGGEGMGPLERIATEISKARLPAFLVVITGRNRQLKERLEKYRWHIPTQIHGFVREMPEFMSAADILVTKSGPGTISEAFTAGLPMVLYSHLPGQEAGNPGFVISNGAGIWAPAPKQVVAALSFWLNHPTKRLDAAAASKRLARPGAALQIAQILIAHLN